MNLLAVSLPLTGRMADEVGVINLGVPDRESSYRGHLAVTECPLSSQPVANLLALGDVRLNVVSVFAPQAAMKTKPALRSDYGP